MRISQTQDAILIAKLNKPVHDLHHSLYPAYFREYNAEEIIETFKQLIKKKNNCFFVLEDDEEAVGYAWIEKVFYPETAFKKAYTSIYIHQLSINESKRQKGYGTKLMDYIYGLAKKDKIYAVELDYWIDNITANDFYKKHGFKPYREFVYKQL